MATLSEKAANLALDIMKAKFHLPLVDGKINYEKIYDQIVIGIYAGDLVGVTQKEVDIAISCIEDLLEEHLNAQKD